MKKQATRTEIQITGTLKQSFKKVEKKYYKSIRIPTGDDFFIQTSIWVPYTPGYSKLPKVVLTLNNHREKIQILFPSALDLMEFCDVLNRFIQSELKTINQAHTESTRDYQLFRELLEHTAGARAKEKAEEDFINQKQSENGTNTEQE